MAPSSRFSATALAAALASERSFSLIVVPLARCSACDIDGSKLIQRDDDKPETVKKRLDVFHDQTEPLIEWYEKKDLLRRFDGERSPDEVHNHIRATLATLKLEAEL